MAIATEPILEAENIDKRFPGVHALDNVSLTITPGEVHAVVGENGAGKSTLMKILAGAYGPDRGTIRIDGEAVTIENPRAAQDLGIITIYQELSLVDALSVGENIFLGDLPTRLWWRAGGSTGPRSGGARPSYWSGSGCGSGRRPACGS